MSRLSISTLAIACLSIALGALQAGAEPCCSGSSDSTPASQLQAEFSFATVDSTLSVCVANQTADPAAFNINEIFFNGAGALTLQHVDDDCDGDGNDRTADWGSGSSMGAGTAVEKAESVGGFDDFNFGLFNGTGLNAPSAIRPGNEMEFQFGITSGTPSFPSGFVNPRGREVGSYSVAAKFVSCRGSACLQTDDSAFGAQEIGAPLCTMSDTVEASCSGGVDEDCDGKVDCADADCSGDAACVCSVGCPGDVCSVDSDCASHKCRGKPEQKTCR